METILRLYFDNDPIRSHATYSHNPADAYSKDDDLKKGTARDIAYATYESNYTLLDGGFRFYPEDLNQVHNGFIGTMISGPNGYFDEGVSGGTIQIDLDSSLQIDKITIRGAHCTNDFASEILIKYFQTNQLLQEYTIYPDSVDYTFSNVVENVNKIIFEIIRTNKPYRRSRLTEIIFGDELEFRGESVVSSNIVMETSLISTELPYGTFTGELYSETNQFDITDPNSFYSQLHNRMMLDVLFDNDRSIRHIGRYYLDNWKNESDYKIRLEAIDLIGLMDDIQYLGDLWLSNVDFRTVINRVLSFVPAIKIIAIDPNIPEIQLCGYLQPGTIRDAMQQVLFAAGCTAVLQEDNAIYITYERWQNITNDPTWKFTVSDKLLDKQSLTIKQPITRIELNSHHYSYGTTTTKLFEGTLPVGINTIMFPEPSYVTQSGTTGGTLIGSGPAYANINVTTAGNVVINGSKYIDSVIQNSRDIVSANTKPNIIKIAEADLVSPENVQTIINRIESYYALKYQQNFRVCNPEFYKTGYVVHVDTIYGKRVAITVERVEIDLSGGFICDITGTGIMLSDDPNGKLRKTIIIGNEGTILPTYFLYPYAGLQTFTVSLKPDYSNLYSINVSINGSVSVYYANSTTFTLNNPTQFTDVQISFQPLPEKAITVGSGLTVTPSTFKYPSNTEQTITVRKNSTNNLTYIKIIIDGVQTLYDADQTTFLIKNTTSSTTVSISELWKATKSTTRNPWPFPSPFNNDMCWLASQFYYPVIGSQTLSGMVNYPNPNYDPDGFYPNDIEFLPGKANFQWVVDGVVKSQQNGVSYSEFNLINAQSTTNVKINVSNFVAGDGGSGGGGGGGYTPWTGTINSNDSALRSSQWIDSSTLITFMSSGQHVTVTGEVTGSIVFGFPNQSLWYAVTIADGAGAGLSGYVHSGLVNR